MASAEDVNKFLQQTGALSFPFESVGDSVYGVIVDMDVRQQTDMDTGDPLTFKDGTPRNLIVITLQTELQDSENDDGKRAIWCKGGNFTAVSGHGTSGATAIRDALKAANVSDIEVGGKLKFAFTGLAKASVRGYNAP